MLFLKLELNQLPFFRITISPFTNLSIKLPKVKYYFKTTLIHHGNYSYLVWADDTSGNYKRSEDFEFSVLSNWDVDMDGECTVFDQVLVSNYYGHTGYPGWIREDVDNNGIVGVYDIVMVSNHYGEFWWT